MLLKIRNIVSTLFLAEAYYDIKLLEEELLNLYDREADKQAVSLFLNWFRQLATHGKVSPEGYAKLDQVYRTKEEVRTMLVATLERERRSIYQAGRAEGRAEGEQAAQRQMLLQLLQWRFQLAEPDQTNFAQQIDRIRDSQHLVDLINALLQPISLEAFVTQMAKYTPADNA